MTKIIRDFIYLDKDRLNSLYSQVFEGVVQAVVESYSNEMRSNENAKSILKNQTIETKVAEASNKVENKILYDHMYNSLEEKLVNVIYNLNSNEITLSDLADKPLVKVTGKTTIQDYNRLKLYMEKFNEISSIIAYSTYSSLSKSEQKKINLNQYAKSLGLSQDEKILKNIKTLTEFFNQDGYDILISPSNSSNFIYRGVINKDYLRINPDLIRTSYGDEPPMNWTMVGQITYIPKHEVSEDVINETVESIGDSYQNMFKSYREMEKVFFEGKENKKIHIAPLAIYTEMAIKS